MGQQQGQLDLSAIAAILGHAPVGFALFDRELRYLQVNHWLAEANGLSEQAHLGKTPREVMPAIADGLEPRLRAVIEDGKPLVNVELSGGLPRDPSVRRHWIVSYYPVLAPTTAGPGAAEVIGVGTVVMDVTERRQTLDTLRLRNLQQAVVAELGQRALEGMSVEELLDEAVALLAATLETEFSEVLELVPDGSALRLRAGVGWRRGMVGEAMISAGPDSQAGYVLNADKPVIVEDLDQESRFTGLELLRANGVRSGLSVVIDTLSGPYGVLAAHAGKPRSFSEDDIVFLQAMANIIGAAVERGRAEEALRASNERLGLALEAGHMGTWEYQPETNVVTWSPLLEAIYGLAPGEFGGTFEDYLARVHPEDRESLMSAVQVALAEGGGPDIEHRIIRPDGEIRWVQGKGGAVLDEQGRVVRMLGLALDVTDQKHAEEERAGLLTREREARTQAEAAGERLSFLAEAAGALGTSLDYGHTLQEVARLAVPGFADRCTVDLHDQGGLRRVAVASVRPAEEERLWGMLERVPPAPGSAIWSILESGEGDYTPTQMTVPLVARGRSIGVLTFGVSASRHYDDEAFRLAADLAHSAALAIDNARLFRERTESERRFRRLAGTLQESLLPPHLPEIPGVEMAAAFRPTAKGIEVGGDFYDVFPLRGRGWGVVIGDVCGKGPEAATLTALARYTLRTAAMQQRRPSRAVATLNEAMMRDSGPDASRFITLAYGTLRPAERGMRMSVCVGGHPLPLILRASGKIETLGKPGMVVGVFDDCTLHDSDVLLAPGDTVLLFTDGVIEARGPGGVYGDERLREALASGLTLSPAEIAQQLEEDVLLFSRGGVRDDLAILVLRITP